MKVVLVNFDESAEHFVEKAKEELQTEQSVEIKGRSRDTVMAVDVAELLKIAGFHVGNIVIATEEEEKEGKKIRTSTLTIEVHK